MKNLFVKIFIICTIYSGCVIPTYTEKYSLTETNSVKSEKKIKNLLVVGVGSTASRLFLENLSFEIKKIFAREDIRCDFTYAGKIPRRSHIDMSTIVTSQYDTYLVINPIDTSFINAHKSKAMFVSPLPGGYSASGSVIGNQFKENYYVELYTNDSLEKLWQAELKVDFDVAHSDKFKKIAGAIFERFLKNGLLPRKKE